MDSTIDFNKNYPKESEVGPVVWPAVKQWDGMCINVMSKQDEFCLDYEFYETVLNRIKAYVAEKFNIETLAPEQYLINRWRVGRGQSPHLDYFVDNDRDHDYKMLSSYNLNKNFIDSFKNTFKTKHYSSLVYLNSDYKGGELYFPQHNNYTIKPEPGTLVCFKGDENSLHGVHTVTDGIRYTLSLFWEDTEYFNKINTNRAQNTSRQN